MYQKSILLFHLQVLFFANIQQSAIFGFKIRQIYSNVDFKFGGFCFQISKFLISLKGQ